jgi:hypothetical protein
MKIVNRVVEYWINLMASLGSLRVEKYRGWTGERLQTKAAS